MSSRRIINSFNEWRQTDEPLVLATVYDTEGSTYSKAGHRIIISTSGDYQGLISGGCVEGDLAAHAHLVFVTGEARTITYDLREDEDAIWGMGVGCDGVIKILLQRLDAATRYEPFQTITERQIVPHGGGTCVTVVESEDSELPLGATWIDWGTDSMAWQMPDDRMSAIRNQSNALGKKAKSRLLRQPSRGGAFTALHASIRPIPRLLILGAGPDAAPLVTIANELGWFITIVDHRQIRINDPAFMVAEHRFCVPLKEFPTAVEFDQYAAAIIMSHNLEADGQYVSHLMKNTDIRYIGLLGPNGRRDRLIEAHDLGDPEFTARLHGPAGLSIGADSPETIALSILAQIHKTLDAGQNQE
ncbi:MAG: XdhC/CoxI family protein [Gammaproteobacteria bacterium]|jgi:xanthine/CO dehydrogenase XdhC/CoxF family maturation factor|nr:hypothetical protein [Gammaproteobacteria bacterium]MDP7296321.1 XdhC/CoxI family protein [Gammaproteobacteria bacterium]MDP7419574.1 XdhC/CoxI family protein [Gammaproteobacteria bacterium]MDP7661286.1 XdhC/CoxI family protein [Gammaproteobacteria bacterium]HJP39015.1 XdhC/CoxI family protein [Gammaproteobacteria bacterium]